MRDELRLAGRSDQASTSIDDRCVHPVLRFHDRAARDDGVEMEGIHVVNIMAGTASQLQMT